MEYPMARIRSNMSREERAKRLSRNNGDALDICMTLARVNDYLLELLDRFGIYEGTITQLFGLCERNLVTTGLLLRACEDHVGGLTQDKLTRAIANNGAGIDVKEIIAKMIDRAG